MRHSVQRDYDYVTWSFQVLAIKTVGTSFSNESEKKFPGPGRHKYSNSEEETCYEVEVTGQQHT